MSAIVGHRAWPALLAAALVAACGSDQEELVQWMEQQRREVRPNVQPLTPPKKFDPEPYVMTQSIDPFSPQKLAVALRQEARESSAVLQAELNRRKEPLEAFPLDGMKMVGSVDRRGQRFGLLKVDSLLYHVKVGDYLGQNYGKITTISETEIALREIVQDAAGEWIERPSALQLQEGAR